MRLSFVFAFVGMAIIVAASNFLVQFPLKAHFFSIDLSKILTLGAFTYPVAFLVTDLTNRHFGAKKARYVVLIGFAIAVIWSIFLASPRIAIASGTAFLLAQFLDIAVFNRLVASKWWRAPLISSFLASALDTILFFGIAFSAKFAFLDSVFGVADGSLAFEVAFLDVGFITPLWVSLAGGDFIVKIIVALLLLLPYGLLIKRKLKN